MGEPASAIRGCGQNGLELGCCFTYSLPQAEPLAIPAAAAMVT